jgi:hypothetical protein
VDADGPDNVAGTSDDDLRVALNSPVIDAGENAALPWTEVADLAQRPRFVDEPSAPNVGLGTPPMVDMGAFEFASALQPSVLRPSFLTEASGIILTNETFPSWYSDDAHVFGIADEFNPNAELLLAFFAPASATSIGVSIEASVTRSETAETVQAWDFNMGSWVPVYGRIATIGDSRHDADLPGDASRFRHASTGQVLLRVVWAPYTDTSAFDGWGVRLDQAVLFARF